MTSPEAEADDARAASAAAIVVKDLHLKLESEAGTVNILNGINLTLEAGTAAGVVGPSGSGKTSLMMLLGGLERPSAGSVTVAGRDITGLSEDALAEFRRDTIGIIFQHFHLVPTMTALENVAVPLEFAGARDAFARAKTALESVGLSHRLTHYPSQLSGGEQQRVAIARAFVVEPKILLADEPTGNLDQKTGKQVMDLLFDLTASRGTTLVLITHDPAIAARCNRIIELLDGKIRNDRDAATASAMSGNAKKASHG